MFLLLAAVASTATTVPPEQAAGNALMQCVSHSAGMVTINAKNAEALKTNGLVYQADVPVQLKSMASTPYGTGQFARSLSYVGDVWAVGYDQGSCIVMVLGTQVEPIERRLKAMFDIPGGWTAEPIEQINGPTTRWSQYGWNVRDRHLTAQMKVQPLPETPIKGLVMVTISPEAKKKNR